MKGDDTVSDVRDKLLAEYDVRGNEVVMRCARCGKHFLVNISTAAQQLVEHSGAKCSPCGTYTLQPVLREKGERDE